MLNKTFIPRLFLFGVDNADSVKVAFSNCLVITYSENEILNFYGEHRKEAENYSDESIAFSLRQINDISGSGMLNKNGCVDLMVVYNPDDKVIDVLYIWANYHRKILINSIQDAQKVSILSRRISNFYTASVILKSHYTYSEWKRQKIECPEISEFYKKCILEKRKSKLEFNKHFKNFLV